MDRLIVPGAHSLDEVGPRLAGWAAGRGLCVELLQADGEFSFDAMLRDLAAHADRATAHVTAKSIEYPTSHLRLAGPAWPWRPTTLLALTVAAGIGAGIDILRGERELAFVHPLVREVAYLDLSPRDRRRGHARAAQILAGHGTPPEQVAAHILLAPRTGSDLAVAALRQAARHALARSAPANAAYEEAFSGGSLDRCIDRAERALADGTLLAEETSWELFRGRARAVLRRPAQAGH